MIEIGCPEHTFNAVKPSVSRHRSHVDGRHVVDVDEVPHLAAVLENPWRLASFDCRSEDRRDAGVRRVARHHRAVDVVVAQRDDRAARRLRPGQRVVLLGRLARRVQAARPQRRVLAHQPPAPVPHRRSGSGARTRRRRGRLGRRGSGSTARARRSRSRPGRRPPSTTPAPAGGSPRRNISREQHRRPKVVVAAVIRRIGSFTPAPTTAA